MLALCALAALRVFVFSAAFPYFNNVDEKQHFDLVDKYSRGHVPGKLDHLGGEAAWATVMYGSAEYFLRPEECPGGRMPPPVWTLPYEKVRENVEGRVEKGKTTTNHESTQPPLYYAVAGLWKRLGALIGMSGGQAAYWVRFLNVPLYGLLTWLAYSFARAFFPEDKFLRLGAPLLVAFFPQDVFFSVNNDVFLPLVSGAALLCLLAIHRGETKSYLFHAGAGLCVAAALLVKQSSIGIVMIAVIVAALRIWRPQRGSTRELGGGEDRKTIAGKTAVLLLAAAAPIAAWSVRNYFVLGDFAGAAVKTSYLGWSRKPVGEIFHHPIFTPSGVVTFWNGTMEHFWRGELIWGKQPLSSNGWNSFYSISSFVLLAAGLVAFVVPATSARSVPREQRSALGFSLTLFALSLVFLAAISVLFDFGECYYPSREQPFLVSGRLALGALIPFAVLYLKGLSTLLPGTRGTALRWAILVLLVVSMTLSEIWIFRPVFGSQFNWYHMI